jgi:PAS domain S-box-containing protein
VNDNNDNYKVIIDSVSHGVQESDLTGTIVFANKQNEQLSTFTIEEIIGKKKIWEMCVPEDLERNKETFHELIKTQPPPTPFITRQILKDGKIIDLQVDWNYKRDKNGKLIGFISILTDISHYVKQHRELTENLQKANKILHLVSIVSKSILSIDSFDLNNCIKMISSTMDLEELFICHKNGQIKCTRISRENDDNYHITKRSTPKEKCPWCLKNGTDVFEGSVNDFPNTSCIYQTRDTFKKDLTFIVIPITIYDELWGMIGFGKKEIQPLSPSEMNSISSLGRLIAIIINNEDYETGLISHIKQKFGQVQKLL